MEYVLISWKSSVYYVFIKYAVFGNGSICVSKLTKPVSRNDPSAFTESHFNNRFFQAIALSNTRPKQVYINRLLKTYLHITSFFRDYAERDKIVPPSNTRRSLIVTCPQEEVNTKSEKDIELVSIKIKTVRGKDIPSEIFKHLEH
jgi:hypothetical protein